MPRVIPETVRLIDVMPTIADLWESQQPKSWEGLSFAPWLDGEETGAPPVLRRNRFPVHPVQRARRRAPETAAHGRTGDDR
jgi:arylsulfatase A-like enzyme